MSLMLYCFLMMDGLCALFLVLAIVFGTVLFSALIYWMFESTLIPHFKSIAIVFSISTFLLCITPNTKQAAIIFGVPYMMNYSKDINLDKIPVKLVNYLNNYLDVEIDKMVKPKSEQEDKK